MNAKLDDPLIASDVNEQNGAVSSVAEQRCEQTAYLSGVSGLCRTGILTPIHRTSQTSTATVPM